MHEKDLSSSAATASRDPFAGCSNNVQQLWGLYSIDRQGTFYGWTKKIIGHTYIHSHTNLISGITTST